MGQAQDVPSAVEAIKQLKPELVFLDVEMPFGNAFDVLENTRDQSFQTIFITAYSDYAIKALNFSAAYYILKPIDIDELIHAVDKVRELIHESTPDISSRILVENMRDPVNKRIVLPTVSGFEVVQVKDIIRLEGSGNYTELYLTEKRKKVVSKVLKHFEEMLDGPEFMRVHRSHIINLSHVTGYHKGRGGVVTMTDGSEVEISPQKKDELISKFS